MIKKLFNLLITGTLLLISTITYGQSPNLGTTVDFVIFSSDGAVSNTGTSQLTGHVGTNNGSNTGFGNVNGVMHNNDIESAQAASDLLNAYNQLNNSTPEYFPSPLLGNGQTLIAGVYSISGAAILNLDIILDAENNSNAVFIFKIDGPLSANANSKVNLINGTQACNVFWIVEGLVDMASGTTMRGTVIANNAGINMSAGNTLEGRLLSTTGAITVNGMLAYTPIGCGSPILTGPEAPELGVVACFGIFSANGPVTNAGVSNIIGDVGTNAGLTTGFDSLLVSGTLRHIPDNVTSQAADDLSEAFNYLITLPQDIELLYPAQFGSNLVLTPHTYVLNGGTFFKDTLYLNAQGNENAVFVIKIFGALETSSYSNVVLTNGTQAKNVFWMVNGEVNINDYSTFNGTILTMGAINLYTGTTLNGRALTTVGALESTAIEVIADMIPDNCESASVGVHAPGMFINNVLVYPNPFSNFFTVEINDASQFNKSELIIYNVLGIEVMNMTITSYSTTINNSMLTSGMYFYKVIGSDKTIKTGIMISNQ